MARPPRISMILTTRDRPSFLPIALRCFAHQTWENRELIVVDDGDQHPADEAAVAAVGGTLVRVPTGTVLGAKLNAGIERATGALIQKMDDDDYYAPTFLANNAAVVLENWQDACRPIMVYTAPLLFFHVAAWELRRSSDNNLTGATICFTREMWEYRPFREVPSEEDLWMYRDQARFGGISVPVRKDLEHFVQVRHAGGSLNRAHTWQRNWSNQPVEESLSTGRPLHPRSPEEVILPWAIDAYRTLRSDILARK